jgi:hypothetical protein
MIAFFNSPDTPPSGAFSLITDSGDCDEINVEYVKNFPGLLARHIAWFGVPITAKVAFACIGLAA